MEKKEGEMDSIQSKTIDWLRFPLAVLVVYIHTNNLGDIQGMNYSSLSCNDIVAILQCLISRTIGGVAVPCFFLFSGYLFFYKVSDFNKAVYLKKIKSRVKTLLIPFILWNLLSFLLALFLRLIKNDGSLILFLQDVFNNGIWKIFVNYSTWADLNTDILGRSIPNYGPILLPLWFLRDLIVMAVLAPLIYILIKYTRIYGIILLGLLYYTQICFVIPGFSPQLFYTALFYFSLGAYLSMSRKYVMCTFSLNINIWYIIAFLTMGVSLYFYGMKERDYFYPIFVFSGVICLINVTSFLIKKGKISPNKELANASFFIYAIHGLFILVLSEKIMHKILPFDSAIAEMLRYIVSPLLCVFICLCIYKVMKKITPRLLNLLTGNK